MSTATLPQTTETPALPAQRILLYARDFDEDYVAESVCFAIVELDAPAAQKLLARMNTFAAIKTVDPDFSYAEYLASYGKGDAEYFGEVDADGHELQDEFQELLDSLHPREAEHGSSLLPAKYDDLVATLRTVFNRNWESDDADVPRVDSRYVSVDEKCVFWHGYLKNSNIRVETSSIPREVIEKIANGESL